MPPAGCCVIAGLFRMATKSYLNTIQPVVGSQGARGGFNRSRTFTSGNMRDIFFNAKAKCLQSNDLRIYARK